MGLWVLLLLICLCAVSFAQLDSNTVTVTASRNLTVAPDQVVFSVTVISGLNTTLDDVLAALQGLGITAANFSGVNSGPGLVITTGQPSPPSIDWIFTLVVPFTNMKATTASLTSLQQSIAQNNNGLSLSFSVQGTQVSQQLAHMQVCPLQDILSDAQMQAQKLAHVAGLSILNILAISSAINTGGANTALPGVSALPVCSMTVKFSLVQ